MPEESVFDLVTQLRFVWGINLGNVIVLIATAIGFALAYLTIGRRLEIVTELTTEIYKMLSGLNPDAGSDLQEELRAFHERSRK